MGNHHAMKMGIHQLFLWPFSIANCKRLPGRVAQFMASPCGKSMGVTVMQTMGFELPWPSGLMLKLTGNWCHVYFHAKKKKSAKFLGLQNCRPNSFPLNLMASVPSCSGWETLLGHMLPQYGSVIK